MAVMYCEQRIPDISLKLDHYKGKEIMYMRGRKDPPPRLHHAPASGRMILIKNINLQGRMQGIFSSSSVLNKKGKFRRMNFVKYSFYRIVRKRKSNISDSLVKKLEKTLTNIYTGVGQNKSHKMCTLM